MNHAQHRRSVMGGALMMTVLVGALILAGLPGKAWATVDCNTVSATSTTDSDGDGLTDYQECNSNLFTFVGGGALPPKCLANSDRKTCLDPNTKDAFVVILKAVSSILPAISSTDLAAAFSPLFPSVSPPVGAVVHVIDANQVATDRTLITGSAAKAVRVTENTLNDTDTNTLGYCPWGTSQTDGCTVWTQRILNLINSKCAGNTLADRDTFYKKYVLHTILHETAHSLGGLVGQAYYDSKIGYHYPVSNKASNATVMDQYVTITTSGTTTKTCSFPSFTYFNNWNTTLDPPAVK